MKTETILALETTLDDLTPQVAGYVCEQALAAGALDAWLTPVVMKKQRPGFVLTILAPPRLRLPLLRLLLRETTTLGVREARCRRVVLPRRVISVATPYGPIRVKRAGGDGDGKATPEYEDCRAAALRCGVALQTVQAAAVAALPPARRTGRRQGE